MHIDYVKCLFLMGSGGEAVEGACGRVRHYSAQVDALFWFLQKHTDGTRIQVRLGEYVSA
jgi:hypothetical protein